MGKLLPRSLKAAFYATLRIPMGLNAFVYRHMRAPREGTVKAHLGPGKQNYLSGWVNVDANFLSAKIDVWADLRNGLPFRDATVDVFYSNHVIEHLPDALLAHHFGEMFRCLKPGGFIRVGGPHGESAARKLLEGDRHWFGDFPDKRETIGGRYANFIFCRGEHLTVLTPSYLSEIAGGAGFVGFRVCKPGIETNHDRFIDTTVLQLEPEPDVQVPHTLTIEADKPLHP